MTSRPDRAQVELRVATVDDADGIGALHVRSWQVAYRGLIPDPHLDALDPVQRGQRWRAILHESPSTTVVAARGDAAVAFASAGPDREDPSRGEVWAIYADPAAWGTGAGHAVMADAIARLRALGFTEAVLWVLEGQRPRPRVLHPRGLDARRCHPRRDDRGRPAARDPPASILRVTRPVRPGSS